MQQESSDRPEICLTRTFHDRMEFEAWAEKWHNGNGNVHGFVNKLEPNAKRATAAQRKRLAMPGNRYFTPYGWMARSDEIPDEAFAGGGMPVDIWMPTQARMEQAEDAERTRQALSA